MAAKMHCTKPRYISTTTEPGRAEAIGSSIGVLQSDRSDSPDGVPGGNKLLVRERANWQGGL